MPIVLQFRFQRFANYSGGVATQLLILESGTVRLHQSGSKRLDNVASVSGLDDLLASFPFEEVDVSTGVPEVGYGVSWTIANQFNRILECRIRLIVISSRAPGIANAISRKLKFDDVVEMLFVFNSLARVRIHALATLGDLGALVSTDGYSQIVWQDKALKRGVVEDGAIATGVCLCNALYAVAFQSLAAGGLLLVFVIQAKPAFDGRFTT